MQYVFVLFRYLQITNTNENEFAPTLACCVLVLVTIFTGPFLLVVAWLSDYDHGCGYDR